MHWSLLLVGMALAGLASCSLLQVRQEPIGPRWPDQKQVDVELVERGGRPEIEVGEEPAVVAPDTRTVVWSLRASASNFKFAGDGILFVEPSKTKLAALPFECRDARLGSPQDFGRCSVNGDGRLFICHKLVDTRDTCYAYSVKLEPRAGGSPIERDPWMKSQ